MNIGAIVLLVALGAAGAALAAYVTAWAGHPAGRRLARTFFAIMTASLAVASVLLMGAILADDFRLEYVANYSSRLTPLIYKISAFWGGQAGTILLWALLQGIVGLILLRRRDDWEAPVMTFLMVPQLFLMLLLMKVSPFRMVPPPPDGNGLNPLLRDPWMAIHPPIVFVGYAALVAPFAIALAALARRRTDAWIPKVLPWTLFSVVSLGLGLFIGGFWAYKVLGWGGYWGWDPVENSSLAPWIAAGALLHGLLAQRSTGILKKTNLALAAGAYVLVLYATYMTRSGVLSDFSVHSFAEGGINALLLAMMGTAFLLPAALMIVRWRSLSAPEVRWGLSLGTVMVLAILLLMMGTALLVVGTSWPILSGLAGTPASPGPEFYNRTALPIGIALAALLTAAPLMGWAPMEGRRLARVAAPGAAAGILAAAFPVAMGWWPKGGAAVLLLLAVSVGGLVTSLLRVARQARVSAWLVGAGVAHAGLALMLVGIVTTSAFDRTESVELPAGETRQALGYRLTLNGYHAPHDGLEPHFEIVVAEREGEPGFGAHPVMFRSGPKGDVIARPHIERGVLGDLYIATVSHRPPRLSERSAVMQRDQPLPVGPATLTFRRFASHAAAEGSLRVGAVVDVEGDGEPAQVTLGLTMGPEGLVSEPVELPLAEGITARLDGMQVESGAIRVTFVDPSVKPEPEALRADVSTKPLVNALWAGILLLAGGSGLAVVQRSREGRVLAALPAAAEAAEARAAAPPVPAGMVPLTRRSRSS